MFNSHIPTTSPTLSKDFPQYIKYLDETFRLIEHSAESLEEYMMENDHYTRPLSPPHISPEKLIKPGVNYVSDNNVLIVN